MMDMPNDSAAATAPIERLRQIMARLRNPDGGCPWDCAQTFATIAPYTIEEAYEVADAIERGDLDDLRDELGDLLLQVVFHAQMAAEAGLFGFDDVADAISDKLVRRHPHVFGDASAATPDAVKASWDAIKAEERRRKGARGGILDTVPANLPTLVRAQKMQKAMATVGFDWPDRTAVIAKIAEEVGEFTDAAASGDPRAIEAEFGDLLFSLVNLARHAGIDADTALRATNAKFAARVRHMEAEVADAGTRLADHDLASLETAWVRAKHAVG